MLRETKMAFLALAAVRSFVRRSPRFLGFSGVPKGPGDSWAVRDWRRGSPPHYRLPVRLDVSGKVHKCLKYGIFYQSSGLIVS